MSRIESRFAELASQKRKALVTYIVCGDPEPGLTLGLMQSLVSAGADIIELGVPFSDPMADGPAIQKAHERALVHNTSLKDTLALVAEFRKTDDKTPVVLMGYANPVEKMGYDLFADTASEAGVDGVITVDIPPEEAADFNEQLVRVGMDNIFLLAPTTTMDRAQQICDLATGFLYYVSLKGVTGAGHLDVSEVESKLTQFRSLTKTPLCVGFGIKDAASARQVAEIADGVVVGSALVDCAAQLYQQKASGEEIATALAKIVSEIRHSMDNLPAN